MGLAMSYLFVGANLEDPPHVARKKSCPLDFFLTPSPRHLQVAFLLVELNICAYLLQGHVFSALQALHGGFFIASFCISELERQQKRTSTAGEGHY